MEQKRVPKLIMVVGLPGSGKSHLSDKLSAERQCKVFHDVLGRHLIPHDSEGFCSLLRSLQAGQNCVANEICLAHRDKREAFSKLLHMLFEDTVRIEWIFFENDPEQCKANVQADKVKTDYRGRLAAIKHYAPAYDIPHDASRVPVFRPNV